MRTLPGTILVVDDNASDRVLLASYLRQHGYLVETAEDGQQALTLLSSQPFDVVLLDLLMPMLDGFQVLERMKAEKMLRHIPVIIVSALEEMHSVVRCIEMGAIDHLAKPVKPDLLHARIHASLAQKRVHDQEREYLRHVKCLTDAATALESEMFDPDSLTDVVTRPDALGELARVFQRMACEISVRQHLQRQIQQASKDRYKFEALIGKSPAMQKVYEQIVLAAASETNVILSGESGTGKELVARTIHDLSSRCKKPYIPVNCGAIPEALFESEFFGHRKGAFTGADKDKRGYFDAAHTGTLFLDEIDALTHATQVKFLRVLQDGEYTPLGDTRSKTTDIRVIAATNKDLIQQLRSGVIREDFFYRVYVTAIYLPPLRERREDIPLLIEYFLRQYGHDDEVPPIPAKILEVLCAYDWPGNVRELQNELQRYLTEQTLEFLGDVRSMPEMLPRSSRLPEAVEALEKRMIINALRQNFGHRGRTAKTLGIPLRTLHRKLKKYGLVEEN